MSVKQNDDGTITISKTFNPNWRDRSPSYRPHRGKGKQALQYVYSMTYSTIYRCSMCNRILNDTWEAQNGRVPRCRRKACGILKGLE